MAEMSLERYNKMAERLTELEHLLAERQWIPCSEHTPIEDGEYITTVEDGEGMFVTSNDWRQDWQEWGFLSYYGKSDDPAWRRVTNVVAWMPMPEPANLEGT